jgi:hypothetical protein
MNEEQKKPRVSIGRMLTSALRDAEELGTTGDASLAKLIAIRLSVLNKSAQRIADKQRIEFKRDRDTARREVQRLTGELVSAQAEIARLQEQVPAPKVMSDIERVLAEYETEKRGE